MDVRNISGHELNVPSLGLVVPPGATVNETAGPYAIHIDPERIQGLIPQAGAWEPADSEAEKWLKAYAPPVDPETARAVALRESATRAQAMPETVGLMPTPEDLAEREKAAAERKAAEAEAKKSAPPAVAAETTTEK